MYLFDIIWRRFHPLSVFDVTMSVTPAPALYESAERLCGIMEKEAVSTILQNPVDQIFAWAAGQDNGASVTTMMDMLKAVAGIIAVSVIQCSRRLMDAVFDFFLHLLEFIAENMDVKWM